MSSPRTSTFRSAAHRRSSRTRLASRFDPAVADEIRGIEGVDVGRTDGDPIRPAARCRRRRRERSGRAHVRRVVGERRRRPRRRRSRRVRRRSASTRLAIDKATADARTSRSATEVTYLTDTGQHTATLTGTVGTANPTASAVPRSSRSTSTTAMERLRHRRHRRHHRHLARRRRRQRRRAGGDRGRSCRPASRSITGEQLAEESSDEVGQFIDVFGTGLLIFAFITAFVSAFIINNVFAHHDRSAAARARPDARRRRLRPARCGA